MKSLRVLPKAVEDLDGIWLHIAEDDMAAADAFIDHLGTVSIPSAARP